MVQKVIFSKEEVASILNSAGDFYQAAVYSGNTAGINTNIRNSLKHDFQDNSVFKDIILPKVKQLGIIDIANEAMILKYGKGHFFKRHQDVMSSTSKRKKNLIIQLSDTDDYEGGELEVDGTVASKEIGNVILFNCASFHEVNIIESGTRFCFLAHLQQKDLKKENYLM
jgi:predicted 2-oxoglutarate/Fe(II)-dependent dioxygenase YbiX